MGELDAFTKTSCALGHNINITSKLSTIHSGVEANLLRPITPQD